MAEIEPLVSLSELKVNVLNDLAKNKRLKPVVEYDKDFDALIITFAPPDAELVVYYLNQHLGLIFDDNTLEIVGLQVEDFERDFLPSHASVMHIWRDIGETPKDVGELMIVLETKKISVAREVVKVSEELLPEIGADLMLEALA